MINFDGEHNVRQRKSKMLGGIILIAFGTLFLLDRTGVDIPNWLYSWKMILIAVGIVSIYKHQYKEVFGYVMIFVGSVFLINDFKPDTIDSSLILPVVVIVIGAAMILKAMGILKKKPHHLEGTLISSAENSPEDFLDLTTFFGGTTKIITSKNFKGANVTSVFGGTELNFTKADIQHPVEIKSTTAFGGLVLIVPSNWQVQSEMVTIFGGVDDKRPIMDSTGKDNDKILILKGNCTFGGVEIQSYI